MPSKRTKSRGWRPWQFSLRTLIALMLILGTGCGWLAMRLEQTRKQREAVGQLVALGLTVSYDYEVRDGKPSGLAKPPRSFWRQRLGDDFFDRVVAVEQASGTRSCRPEAGTVTPHRMTTAVRIAPLRWSSSPERKDVSGVL